MPRVFYLAACYYLLLLLSLFWLGLSTPNDIYYGSLIDLTALLLSGPKVAVSSLARLLRREVGVFGMSESGSW